MALKVINPRSSLTHTKDALLAGALTIGFIGGSITESGHSYGCYCEHIVNGIAQKYPDVKLTFCNAGIGATGSDLGVLRVERDLIDQSCDLVLIEFAVNDNGVASEIRQATREGLIRKLIAKGNCDIVLVYTYCQDMYSYMIADTMPPSVSDFEQLAIHYNISSVWMGLNALNHVKQGTLRWEEWLPDGLHPNAGGSRYYADAVLAYLDQELAYTSNNKLREVAPLYTDMWEHSHVLPLKNLNWKNPWKLRCVTIRSGYEEWLDTSAVGATLTIPFFGTGIALALLIGTMTADLEYSIDDAESKTVEFERFEWTGENGWFKLNTLATNLVQKEHELKLAVKHSGKPLEKGTRISIALIGVLE